jgi:hypothetical protein
MVTDGETVETIRELIAVPNRIETVLLDYVERSDGYVLGGLSPAL